jgi:hypothetical protein
LEEAISSFRARGDLLAAARAMGTLSTVLFQLGDPRWAELPAEAVALLEPLPPGLEVVGALTELARAEALQGRGEAGLRYAEQALALAERPSLPRPATHPRLPGYFPRHVRDRGGLDDFREAITLATEAGQGREVANLHNNLGISLWRDEGPADALEVLRAGIEFAQTRGLTEAADKMTATSVELLFDSGEQAQALTLAAEIADRAEASGNLLDLANVRMVQTRILTLRGQAAQTGDSLDWLETTSRETAATEITVAGLGSAAAARAALEQHDAAA